jgi:hypothetical protein
VDKKVLYSLTEPFKTSVSKGWELAQQHSVYLACLRPQVQSAAPQKINK